MQEEVSGASAPKAPTNTSNSSSIAVPISLAGSWSRASSMPPSRHSHRSVLPWKFFMRKTLRWEWREGGIELALDHEPANEIGTAMLEELEVFVGAFGALAPETSSCIIYSARKSVF